MSANSTPDVTFNIALFQENLYYKMLIKLTIYSKRMLANVVVQSQNCYSNVENWLRLPLKYPKRVTTMVATLQQVLLPYDAAKKARIMIVMATSATFTIWQESGHY